MHRGMDRQTDSSQFQYRGDMWEYVEVLVIGMAVFEASHQRLFLTDIGKPRETDR